MLQKKMAIAGIHDDLGSIAGLVDGQDSDGSSSNSDGASYGSEDEQDELRAQDISKGASALRNSVMPNQVPP